MGLCEAEISNSLLSNKSSNFSPEEFENALFQKGLLAFGSPARTILFLTAKSLLISASIHIRLGVLLTAARKTSFFHSGCRPLWLLRKQAVLGHIGMGESFSNCFCSSALSSREAVCSMKAIVWNTEPLMRFKTCL